MVLPFPFDQVEKFFRDLFNSISRTIGGIVNNVLSGLNNVIGAIAGTIKNSADSIKTAFFSTLNHFKDQILGALSGVPSKIAGLLGGINQAISPILNSLRNTVQGMINSLSQVIQTRVLPGVENIFRSVSNLGTQIYNQLSHLISPIVTNIQNGFNDFSKSVSNLGTQIYNQLSHLISPIVTNIQNGFNQLFKQNDSTHAVASSTLQGTQDLISGFNQFAFQAGASFEKLGKDIAAGASDLFNQVKSAVGGIYDTMLLPLIQGISNIANKIKTIIRPTGSITPPEALAQMQQSGIAALGGIIGFHVTSAVIETITAGQIDVFMEAINDSINSVGITTFANDLITFEYAEGVRPAARREILKKYEPFIPGPGDLVNMVVKEAFVPELRTPAPTIFADNMRENGFTKFWSDTFWTAHWQPIALDNITEMFHRGIISEADFIRRLIILDFRPDDTDLVKQVLFKLPNRVEARLMARFGLLSDTQLDEIIRAEGVREDFIPALRVMMQEFALTSIFTKTETEAITSYENGLISEGKVREMLSSIKRPPNVINADVNLVKFKRETKFRDFQNKAIISAMKKGTISIQTAETRLSQIGMDSEFIGLIIAEFNWQNSISEESGISAKTKDLSVAQLTKALKTGLISAEDTLNALQLKGYDNEEATVLMQISGAITA